MDILDIQAQLVGFGKLIAFADYYHELEKTSILVKLDKADNNDNWYYLYVVDNTDNSRECWHSCENWDNAAKAFYNMTNLD